MDFKATIAPEKKKSVYALEAANFFLADVQTGLGPFLAAYLAGAGWEPGRIGTALTGSGIIMVILQAPAGAIVDQLRSRRLILVTASTVLAIGALLLNLTAAPWAVYTSQVLIGGAGPFLGPALAAVTMGIVGVSFFDRQFGKNQSFNSAGNDMKVRAKFWGESEIVSATARCCGQDFAMERVQNSQVWKADLSANHHGVYSLVVTGVDARGKIAIDEIGVLIGDREKQERVERHRDDALEAWPEHGLLRTQLGPNKNGKKW
jgi:hypothetical protein